MIYEDLIKNKNNKTTPKNSLHINFVKGAFVEVKGPVDLVYKIKFINNKNGQLLYNSTIKNNMWAKCNIEYFVEWKIEVYESDILIHTHLYNPLNKRVYIAFDSKALGDTMAWVPYIDEFRKKHNCEVICSTFMNGLFVDEYTQIQFVEPGTPVHNLYDMYSLGLFYTDTGEVNFSKNPYDPKLQPMQKMATDILGLDYVEIRPKIKSNKSITPKKQIAIGMHGTAQSKYWNNPNGWQEVVTWLNGEGYEVKLISKEGDGYMGNVHPTGITKLPVGPIQGVIEELMSSEMFIGIGSGLSWLSWGLGTKTVIISGFSYDWAEMQGCIRISAPRGKCEGCFNRLRLDAGDWNWCPDHKGTDRQFECTSSITGEMVIRELKKIL